MDSRIDQTFQRLRQAGDKAFIAYVCGGDPTPEMSLEILKTLADTGADIIELGLPFSDPLADGLVNQLAAERSLRAGTTTADCLDLIRAFRRTHQTPIVLFTYLNPVYTYGFQKFQKDARAAGADGILFLDLPPDEIEKHTELHANDLQTIHLISPTTPPDRLEQLAKRSGGFLYVLSRTGITGAHSAFSTHIAEQVANIKKHTATPVCVGFGISTPTQAAEISASADGIIVGSAIVNQIAQNLDSPNLPAIIQDLLTPFVQATRSR